jgi:hypothetical protein
MMATKKRKCDFGDKCYRKNKDHIENYDHPSKPEELVKENKKKRVKIESSETKKVENIEELVKQNEEKIAKIETNESENLENIEALIYDHNKMKMPDDFYDFLDFCKSLDSKDPKNALKEIINLELVGIYDLILNNTKADYKLYYRYFYDPPEFQTVLKGDDETLLHFGYFRDNPNELPDFVAVNEAKIDCKILPKGENIFSAVNWYIDDLLKKKKNEKKLNDLKDLKKNLTNWCEKSKHDWPLQIKTAKLKARDKRVNCKTFHEAGICVEVDSRGFGYREVPETYGKYLVSIET